MTPAWSVIGEGSLHRDGGEESRAKMSSSRDGVSDELRAPGASDGDEFDRGMSRGDEEAGGLWGQTQSGASSPPGHRSSKKKRRRPRAPRRKRRRPGPRRRPPRTATS